MKQEHATYFWQRLQEPSGADWRRPFYAEFDALLAMARSIPELIQACFGMEETPSQHVRDWFDGLDSGEKLRRARFTTQFEPIYRAFWNAAAQQQTDLHLTSRRRWWCSGADRRSVRRLPCHRGSLRRAYHELVAYLEQVSNLIAAAHKIAGEVHGAQSLTPPSD